MDWLDDDDDDDDDGDDEEFDRKIPNSSSWFELSYNNILRNLYI